MKKIKNNISYLLLFIATFIILISMILLRSSPTNIINLFDRLFVSIAFIFSCLFGISLAIFPNWWKTFLISKNNKSDNQQQKKPRILQGHHPTCNNFKSHIIIIRNKIRCAGCLGLTIGSIIAIFLMIFFLFFLSIKTFIILYSLFILGMIIIFFIFLEIKLKKRNVLIHIFSNIIFIIAFFCLTFSIVEITGKAIYGILTIIFCFFWLDTRIQLSNQQHSKTCTSCIESCKIF